MQTLQVCSPAKRTLRWTGLARESYVSAVAPTATYEYDPAVCNSFRMHGGPSRGGVPGSV